MNLTKPEKLAIIFLSALLLAGSILLYIKHSRTLKNITITQGNIKEEFTLQEVEERLKASRRIYINSTDKEQLTNIPGIGEVLAARIIAYRDSHGKFYAAEDLLEVEGVGPKKFDKIKEYIKVE